MHRIIIMIQSAPTMAVCVRSILLPSQVDQVVFAEIINSLIVESGGYSDILLLCCP